MPCVSSIECESDFKSGGLAVLTVQILFLTKGGVTVLGRELFQLSYEIPQIQNDFSTK